jgi:DNA-binding CsgD family transcriptional regulator
MNTSLDKPKRLNLVYHITQFRFREMYNSRSTLSLAVLVIAAIFFSRDLYVDYFVEDTAFSHIGVEAGVFIAVLLALGAEAFRVIKLLTSESTNQEVITRLRKHLSEILNEEFERWHLSKAETEIALLLVKGLSMREIASLRNVKEKSIRQQATGIYTKANVSSRYELTAHFIEDLLAP